ncbi:MAG: MerR family DNA-binding protein [Gemmatimonadetes bacterium]|nr:MerR family DNA-binding protein [Gemmatimonadota bacterium]
MVERVRFIRKAQALGLSLEQVADVLELVGAGERPCARVRRLREKQLHDIDVRLQELHGFRAELAALLALPSGVPASGATVCSIVDGAPPSPRRPSRKRVGGRTSRIARAGSEQGRTRQNGIPVAPGTHAVNPK